MSGALQQLGALGARYRDPVAAIEWSAADASLPSLPPHLLSLAGVKAQAEMPREVLLRFSQIELARLCAAGLWLEGLLIHRVSSGGFLSTQPAEARVMLQEVREEAGHGLMFLEMIERAGLSGVPLLGSRGLLTWIANRLHPSQAEFWAMVYIGETVTDCLAVRALKDSANDENAICPVARQVLLLHHNDEARHIAAARVLLEARLAAMSPLRRLAFPRIVQLLLRHFLRATLYPTAASLRALGLPDPEGTARAALRCPERRRLATACARPALDVLARSDLVAAGPRRA
jgi:hypothetical protein